MGNIKLHIILYLLILPFGGYSQKPKNYIINGDFETHTNCPLEDITVCTKYFNINMASGWDEPSDSYSNGCPKDFGKAVYFNEDCRFNHFPNLNTYYYYGTGTNLFNQFGYQQARSGKAYAGVDLLGNRGGDGGIHGGFIQGQLVPLKAGHKYHFSMYVSHAEGPMYCCGTGGGPSSTAYQQPYIKSLGVYFSDTPMPNIHSKFPLIGLTPHVVNKGDYLYSHTDWMEISGDYIATGNEKYCFIGAFQTDTIRATVYPIYPGNYLNFETNYYIDDATLLDCDNAQRQDFLGPDTILCKLQPFKLSAFQPDTGGVSYLWQNNSTYDTQYVTKTGIYWAEVSIRGCPPSRDSIIVQMYKTPIVDLGPDSILCLTKGFQLQSRPHVYDTGYRYLWSTGDTTPFISISQTDTVSLTIDNHGCKNSDTVSMYQFPLKEFDLGRDTAYCTDTLVTLDATTIGALRYKWSTGDTVPIIKVSKSGLYWAEAINFICVFRDSVKLSINPYPKVDLGPPFLAVCDNINFTLDAGNAGATYKWNLGDTTQLYKVINTGSYKVDVTKNGCAAADSIDITVLPAPVVNLGPDTMLCEGTSKLLDATNTGSSYLWHDFSTKATYLVTSQGLYKVRITKGKCVATDSVYISYTPKPIFSLGNDTSSCFETPLFFDVSSANASLYLWQDNSTLPTYQSSHDGLVWVQVTKDACVLRDSIVLTQLPVPIPDLGPDSFFCAGDDFTLNPGTSFTTYLWNDNSVSNKLKVNQPGTYWVVVTNNSGCKGKDSIALSVQQLPVISLGKDTGLCEPNFILDAGNVFNTYQWQDGSTGTQLHVTDYGTYKVKVSGIRGCTNEAQITITNNCPTELFVPNAFTPNNDGNNEVFMPVGLNIKTFHMDIYNRWGQKVFTTDDITKGWNGKYNNEFAQVDVYVYVATYTNLKGTEFIKTGNVTLMR